MHHKSLLSAAALLVLALAASAAIFGPALAENSGGRSALAIVEDEAAGAFRFMIGAKEIATLDATGLFVDGDLTYTGSTRDVGPSDVIRSGDK